MMNSNKEYPKALFMLAYEQDKIAEYDAALQDIKEILLPHPQYLEFLSSPVFPLSERLSAIDEAFGSFPIHILNFLKLVCENGRGKEILTYIDDFSEFRKASENSLPVSVYSAVPLNSAQKAKLEEKLFAAYKKKILPVYTVDEKLIGGIKIDVNGVSFDGTLEKKLSLIKGVMNG